MIPNQYVGEMVDGADFDTFVKAVKDDARQAKLSTDGIKMKNKEGLLLVTCTGDVANLIRKRKEVVRFRCDKVGAEQQSKEKEKECVKEKG
jgi:hypothetical protein